MTLIHEKPDTEHASLQPSDAQPSDPGESNTSTYSLLGATGQVGGSVLQSLLSQQPIPKINVLVRSRSKLQAQLKTAPYSRLDTSTITIFETSSGVSDIDTLSKCIQRTEAVFLCAAASTNKPGTTVAQDQAKAVVAALRSIREQGSRSSPTKLPRLVVLSSAEAEETPYFSASIPWPIRPILFASNYHIYVDLIAAEVYLHQERKFDGDDWFEFTMVKPGGLSHDISRGDALSFDTQQTFLSYVDLANAMVEVASGDDAEFGKYNGRAVSVVSPGGKAKVELGSGPLLFKGLLVYVVPWLHDWLF
ncbi:Averufin oxidase-like protein [Cyphellophora attinorum]|uniref:Averufin oxidase-like protein n=1 Tax=Cyphellophora attinorum TaxID=1664694 RepID=A0A0N0NIR7_9EURO|nr:Averufin oxidase-like protein [Phialophora attinorum]KPI36058.1 Averufin oxidase-like protein [Phialophora attinorum]